MKKSIFLCSLVLTGNVFAGCIDNFKFVVNQNKINLEMKEQVLISGNELQQELQLLRAKLYDVTVTRRVDNKTKKLIAHQERMIRILEGKSEVNDIEYLAKKLKISRENAERKIELAVSKEGSFCLSHVGDLSDEVENFKKLSRNMTEITQGNVIDQELMEKAIAPKTEEEILRLIKKQ